MTFKTLAMDSKLLKALMEDLDSFINGKEFYRRIGKAWKRGYLLYGPPGTGKSSLIAAMANHLKFDIYDLDLTDVQSNSELRFLLLSTPSRSIIVLEDINCNAKLQNRESKNDPQNQGDNKESSISWMACGLAVVMNVRIIIITSNHREHLDPALLRPGSMDLHICMSYCNISVFKKLAFNYLGLFHHDLFEQIEELIEEVDVTPAEVAWELMKNATDAEASLQGLVNFLREKRTEPDKAKTIN
ncbi:unnamed protein product [Dovyalis caffra]|uniref:AAA+ ATPase domain-containing protein n=1 Tax=Dovyalis caffra TaxID=77055 RepID=A0AAV1S1Q6_9ROSI|nr:unnamed protein product [Dovyalis caffra]